MRQPFLITVGSSLDHIVCNNDDNDDDYDDDDEDEGDKETERVKHPFLPSLGDHSTLTAILVKLKRGIPREDDDGDDDWHYFLRNDSDNKFNDF